MPEKVREESFVRSSSKHYCKTSDIMGKFPKFQHSISNVHIRYSYFLHNIISTQVNKASESTGH
jgi:hypothetical protein